jgi:stromal membrane-associated protein
MTTVEDQPIFFTAGPVFTRAVSQVVSVTLDSWSEDDIAIMEAVGGNAAANSVYEACLPPDLQKPTADASVEERTDWIM